MLELFNSFCICPFFPFAMVAIIANKFSTRKLSLLWWDNWQILLVVTIMFGPNQSNVINICHGLRTFGAPRIQKWPLTHATMRKIGKEPEMILIKSKLKQKQLIICKRWLSMVQIVAEIANYWLCICSPLLGICAHQERSLRASRDTNDGLWKGASIHSFTLS
jgi:hypothetical protein